MSSKPGWLHDLRQQLGLSQGQIAAAAGLTQKAVLKLERSVDPRWSSVSRYVNALGTLTGRASRLEVIAAIGDRRVRLQPPRSSANKEPAMRAAVTANRRSPSAATVWRLRAWDDPLLERDQLDDGEVSISADEIGDLTDWPGPDELRDRLGHATALQGRTRQALGIFVTYWTYFRVDMAEDDLLLMPLTGRRVAIGRISSGYEYRDHPDSRRRHVRSVDWLATVDRALLDDKLRRVVNAPGTICRVGPSDAAAQIARLVKGP